MLRQLPSVSLGSSPDKWHGIRAKQCGPEPDLVRREPERWRLSCSELESRERYRVRSVEQAGMAHVYSAAIGEHGPLDARLRAKQSRRDNKLDQLRPRDIFIAVASGSR